MLETSGNWSVSDWILLSSLINSIASVVNVDAVRQVSGCFSRVSGQLALR